jgi:flagellar biosynthesis protein FlhA
VAEARSLGPAEAVAEHVRQRLGFQIVASVRRADGTLPLIQLAPEWERAFATHQTGSRDIALPPDLFARLATGMTERLARAAETGQSPAFVTSPLRRRFLRTVLATKGLTAPVLSYDEIGTDAKPAFLGLVPA